MDRGKEGDEGPDAPSRSFSPDRGEKVGAEKIEDSDDDEPTPPPPPPPLDVQSRLELRVQPGAFRVAPGHLMDQRRPSDDGTASEDEVTENNRPSRNSRRGNEFDDAYLVEADLVQERTTELVTTMLVEARPVRRWNLIVVAGVGALAVVSIALGVSLGVVVPSNRSKATALTQSSSQPSTSPSYGPSTLPSVAPSRAPSVSPSSVPSSMPTPASLLTFRGRLPSYTTAQLNNESSPQSKAWEWIATVDRPRSNVRRMTQRFALATFFFATSGLSKWKHHDGWLNSTANECTWYGCACTYNGTLVGLALGDNRLSGSLPKELSLLIDLESIQMNENIDLQGTVASEIKALASLRHFELYGTEISGQLPTELGLLSQLTLLDLSDSRISGTIPTEIGQLENLGDLYLSSTQIVGSLPASLGMLSKLTWLDMNYNNLTSTLPAELGNLTKLTVLNLMNNSFTGTIPQSLWRSSLDLVLLRGNSFNGTLSPSIGQAIRISFLSLEANEFVGSIPTELGLLTSLTHLYLHSNHLTGTIPTELGLLTNLDMQGLGLSTNRLTGTLPTELGQLSNVRYMECYDNQLGGSVPSQLCQLVQLSLELELDCDLVKCSCGCTCRYSNESSSASAP